MEKFILELSYGTKVIKNLKSTWIQPMSTQPGYMLCFEDDVYERGVIYRSQDKELLVELQTKMMEAYNNGKDRVQI